MLAKKFLCNQFGRESHLKNPGDFLRILITTRNLMSFFDVTLKLISHQYIQVLKHNYSM